MHLKALQAFWQDPLIWAREVRWLALHPFFTNTTEAQRAATGAQIIKDLPLIGLEQHSSRLVASRINLMLGRFYIGNPKQVF